MSHRLCIAFLFVSSKARLIPIFGMFFYIRVLVAADGIVAPAAVHAGARSYKPCVQQLHGRKVHITQGWHNIRNTVPDGKLRCRARCKFIINRLAGFIRRNRHLVIVPFVAAAFRARTNARYISFRQNGLLQSTKRSLRKAGRTPGFPPSPRSHETR